MSDSQNSELQQKVMVDRYSVRVDGKPVEHTWDEIATRVSNHVGQGEPDHIQASFDEVLHEQLFMPGGRILAAAGAPYDVTPYSCSVIASPHDSRQGLMASLSEWMEIQARGSGVGVNMSSLRPEGAVIHGVNGTSSGPIAWMELFSTMTHKVIQQGGTRRGAAMLMLDDTHPDVLKFIVAKQDPTVLLGANISVAVSDTFMSAVAADADWDLHWGGEVFQTLKAREMWHTIIESAWKSGEPGVVFLERANKWSNSWYFEHLEATNPCAEQPLGANSVCLLGSVNLLKMLSGGVLNENLLVDVVTTGVRFLDNVIDTAYYPIPAQREAQMKIRRMGMGTIGLADMLMAVGLRYGEDNAVEYVEGVYRRINHASYRASIGLSKERGPFPGFDREKYLRGKFIQTLPEDIQEGIYDFGIRNCFLTTQAPTGTIAKVAGVWSGIEPYFSKEMLIENRLGTHRYEAPDSEFLVTAGEVSPEAHIATLAAAQRHIDSAVSKTVNASENHTVEQTGAVYRLAYDNGIKAVAYYRDKSRDKQVLNNVKTSEEEECFTGDCEI